MTGISITSDNLKTIAPERKRLLTKAATYRLHNPQPLAWYGDCEYPLIFTGTMDGKPAAAIFNWQETPLTVQLANMGLPNQATEYLQDTPVTETITIPPHDAALLA